MRLVLRYSLFGFLVNSLRIFLMSELMWRKIVGTCSSVMDWFRDARMKRWLCLFIFSISFVFRTGFC